MPGAALAVPNATPTMRAAQAAPMVLLAEEFTEQILKQGEIPCPTGGNTVQQGAGRKDSVRRRWAAAGCVTVLATTWVGLGRGVRCRMHPRRPSRRPRL